MNTDKNELITELRRLADKLYRQSESDGIVAAKGSPFTLPLSTKYEQFRIRESSLDSSYYHGRFWLAIDDIISRHTEENHGTNTQTNRTEAPEDSE